jgi:DNA-3-methyladenine glycosylase II
MSDGSPVLLARETYRAGLAHLSASDEDLRRVLERYGRPPMWSRRPGFPTLVRIILEQQVSLASADAAYRRLGQAIAPITPRRFLRLDDDALFRIGFSRQKKAYARLLAGDIISGGFDLQGLHNLEDDAVREVMLKVKGIGNWSVDIYLLMALRRPDAWPKADLALMAAARKVKRLPRQPTLEEMDSLGETWRPWRAVAARILWHYYLSSKRDGNWKDKDEIDQQSI